VNGQYDDAALEACEEHGDQDIALGALKLEPDQGGGRRWERDGGVGGRCGLPTGAPREQLPASSAPSLQGRRAERQRREQLLHTIALLAGDAWNGIGIGVGWVGLTD